MQLDLPIPCQARPKAGQPGPVDHQNAPSGCIPIIGDICMALWTGSDPLVVAVATFQGLVTAAVQITALALQKGAATRSENLAGKIPFAALGGRGHDAEGPVGGHLQHHARAQACLYGLLRFQDGPPTRAGAVAQEDRAIAWR